MNSSCPKCDAEDLILTEGTWEWWSNQLTGYMTEVEGHHVALLEIQLADRPYDDSYYDSGYPQGYEGEAFLIFRVGDNYFKKFGTCDSYGTVEWGGKFKQVFAESRNVLVFSDKEIV